MILYHEVDPKEVESILHEGLKRTSRGDKGDDTTIEKTDQLLDNMRPKHLKESGVSRDNNLYGYMAKDGHVVRITDGGTVPIDGFVRESTQAVLELTVAEDSCYVSDLDRYDAVKAAVEEGRSREVQMKQADEYWRKLIPLRDFSASAIRRPEVMITCDIEPSKIRLLE